MGPTPNERSAILIDGAGGNYRQSSQAAAVLSAMGLHSTPLGMPLRPGEAYVSYLVFEVPANRSKLRLQFSAADAEDTLLWGHENSPRHKKITFCLDPRPGFPSSKSS